MAAYFWLRLYTKLGKKICMTTSESKGRFFYKTNRFESIRITNRIESIRIANWNALVHMEYRVGLRPNRVTVVGDDSL